MNVGAGDFPYKRGDLLRRFITSNTRRIQIIDLVKPPVESGPCDAKVLADFASRNLKSFDMPEDQKPFPKGVTGILLTLADYNTPA